MRWAPVIATVFIAAPAFAQPCLRPGGVDEISGTLTQLTLPGPPNYIDIAKGDRPETSFYLKLDAAICVDGVETERDSLGQTRDAVRFIQIVRSVGEYPPSKISVGMREAYAGRLVTQETGHHKTLLMLDEARFLWIEAR